MQDHDVLEWFAAAAARGPARPALECGARRVTYGELASRSDELARTLRRAAPPGVAAVCVADPLLRIVALLGVLKAACVFAPIDLEQPAARLRRLIDHIEPRWLIGEEGSAAAAALRQAGGGNARWCRLDPQAACKVEGAVSHPASASTSPASATVPAAAPAPAAASVSASSVAPASLAASVSAGPALAADDLCYLFPTSGSTGAPKCIAGRYKAIGHFIRWETALLGLAPGVRVSQLTSPYFDAFLRDVFTPLAAGGTLCMPPADEVRLDAEALAEWIEAEEIELIHCVPSLFRLLVSADLNARSFTRLRYVLMAGEPLLHSDLAKWFAACGRRVRIVNLYGPSETTMTKLYHEVSPADLRRRSIPIGKPMAGAAAVVVDRKDRLCAAGTVGEILLRTPYRALGYFKQPELTAAAFVRNPFGADPADVVFRTGDLGRLLADGTLELLGRRDQQVKIRGQRIELQEVEDALLSHPRVLDAAAVARPDAGGFSTLWAVVTAAAEMIPAELRAWVEERLPAYMVPARFVQVAALPRTANGKIDRRALATASFERDAGEPKVAARTATERRVVEIWDEVVGVRDSGVRDDFFAVGGHSLMATRLLLRVRAAFGVEVALRDFLASPTIEALAEKIEELIVIGAGAERIEDLLRELDGFTLDEPGAAPRRAPAADGAAGPLDPEQEEWLARPSSAAPAPR